MNQSPFFNIPTQRYPIFDINRIYKSLDTIEQEIKKINQRLTNLESSINKPLFELTPKKVTETSINSYNKEYSNGNYII